MKKYFKKTVKKDSKSKYIKKHKIFVTIFLLTFIVVLLISFLLIGLRTDGFVSKIFMNNSTVNVNNFNCIYLEQTTNSKLILSCDYTSEKGYFCSEFLNSKNSQYILESSNCELLNNCFDGIKNQNEIDIDCGGVCKSCSGITCFNSLECEDNNPCTNDSCEAEECIHKAISFNGMPCGDGLICKNGNCIIKECTDNSQCDDGNPCTNDNCNMGICKNQKKSEGALCGIRKVCENDSCIDLKTCTNNRQCDDGNPCTFNTCVSGKCDNSTNFYSKQGIVCGDNLFCYNGVCGDKLECVNNLACNDNNPCTINTCVAEKCVVENVTNQTNCGSGMVCENGSCNQLEFCTSSFQCEDNNPCTIDSCISGKCENIALENDINCGEQKICKNSICVAKPGTCTDVAHCNDYNPCTVDSCISGKCVNEIVDDGTSCGESLFCNNGTCLLEPSNCVNNTQCDDENPCIKNKCFFGECVHNILDGVKLSMSGKIYCSNGNVISENSCSNNLNCNDGSSCTIDTCVLGECVYTALENGTFCAANGHEDQICRDGICRRIEYCEEDSECLEDNFCRDNFCNSETHRCDSINLNEGEFCEISGVNSNSLTCARGQCQFSYNGLGLCDDDQELWFNGNRSTYSFMELLVNFDDKFIEAEQNVLAVAVKYVDNDGNFKCAGGTMIIPDYDEEPTYFFNLRGNTDFPKNGFYFEEAQNYFLRTTDYICRVEAEYIVDKYYKNQGLFVPGSIGKIDKFVDYTTSSVDIDFTNTDNCTYINK